jgi:zinc protease
MIRFISVLGLALFAALPARATVDIVPVTSPGGITAWLVEDHSIPFVSLEIRFRGGASLDLLGKRGATYLMTGLLEEGTGNMDAIAYAQRLEELAASFEFEVYDDALSISARMLTENRDEAVAHLRGAVVAPSFPEDAIERVRAQVQSIILGDANDPEDIASATFDQIAWGDHPYSSKREGTSASLAGLTRDDLIAAHQGALALDRVYVGASGDITGEELGLLLDTLLGGLPAEGAPMPDRADYAMSGGVSVVDFETPQSVVVFGHQGIFRDDPDYIAAFILNSVVGGSGFASRLMTEVREERGLTYGIGSYLLPLDHGELYLGQFSSDNARVADAINVVRDQWMDIAENGITQDELEAAKTYLTGAYPLRFDGNGRIANIMVGMQMSDLGTDYIPARNDKVNAVTLDEIRTIAARLLQPENLHFVVVGKPEGLEATN